MSLSDEPQEVMDLVDEHDQVIGVVTREEVARKMMHLPGFVRASNVFIFNDQGEIWTPRRSSHKKIAPNGLDYGAGEHVKAGEGYVDAAIRGMYEELNVEVTEADLEFAGKINNAPVGVPYISELFIYRSNNMPDYNKDDFVSSEWIMPAIFLQRMKSGEAGKADLVLALELIMKNKL